MLLLQGNFSPLPFPSFEKREKSTKKYRSDGDDGDDGQEEHTRFPICEAGIHRKTINMSISDIYDFPTCMVVLPKNIFLKKVYCLTWNTYCSMMQNVSLAQEVIFSHRGTDSCN